MAKFSEFLGLVGGVVGGIVGWLVGGFGAIGWLAGSLLGAMLSKPGVPHGPKLTDLYMPSASYGDSIVRGKGRFRTGTTVIWSTNQLLPYSRATEEHPGRPTEYYARWAVLICDGPIVGITKMWADGKLLFDLDDKERDKSARTDILGDDDSTIVGKNVTMPRYGTVSIYWGDEKQVADPVMENVLGAANCPAYRGRAYAVFHSKAEELNPGRWKGFFISPFGNRVPNINVEVIESTDETYDYGWHTSTDFALPVATANAKFVVKDNCMWMLRGETGAGVTANSYRTTGSDDLEGNRWTDVGATDKGAFRTDFAVVNWGDVRMIGGDNGAGVISYEMWKFGEGDNVWREAYHSGDDLPARSQHALGWIPAADVPSAYYMPDQPLLVLFGGKNSDGDNQQDLWIGYTVWVAGGVSPDDRYISWEQKAADAGALKRVNATLLMFNNRLYLLGGQVLEPDDPDDKANACYRLATDGSGFSEIKNDITGGAANMGDVWGAVVHNERIIAFVNNTSTSNVELYGSSDGVNWVELTVDQYPSKFDSDGRPGFISWNGTLWLIGGKRGGAFLTTVQPLREQHETLATTYVSNYISALCEQAGLSAGDIDVTDATLAATEVRGMVIRDRGPIKDALDWLRVAYFFDYFESGGKIVFKSRGGTSIRTLESTDLSFTSEDGGAVQWFEQSREDEHKIPTRLDLTYYSVDSDYQTGVQSVQRSTIDTQDKLVINIPIVLSDAEAAVIADVALWDLWNEQRQGKIYLQRRHLDLDPTDVVTVSLSDLTSVVRIKRMALASYDTLECDVVIEHSGVYTSVHTGAGTLADTAVRTYIVPPFQVVFLDIPLLRKEDEGHGFYLTTCNYGSSDSDLKEGIDVLLSRNQGRTYSEVWSGQLPGLVGRIETPLAGGVTGLVKDEANSLEVILFDASLSTVTEEELLTGANLAAVGNGDTGYEIIAFQTVSGAFPTYTISNLLRGLFGTEWMIDKHSGDEQFVLLHDDQGENVVGRIVLKPSDRGAMLQYKVIPRGEDEDFPADSRFFTCEDVGLKPYTVARATFYRGKISTVVRDGGNMSWQGFELSWKRRVAFSPQWWNTRRVPLRWAQENYEIVPLTDAGSEVRVYEMRNPGPNPWRNPRMLYSYLDIANDFTVSKLVAMASEGADLDLKIYQTAEEMGRGESVDLALTW